MIDHETISEVEAAVFRRLMLHLRHRTDVQNIDLMGTAGFCRNCLADWFQEAAAERGVEMTRDQARGAIYGMPYDEWRAKYQKDATPEQIEKMNESVARNQERKVKADG